MMRTIHLKLSDQNVTLFFFSINLIAAGCMGYLDEGINSVQFLQDISSVTAMLFIAFLLTSLPVVVYFICVLFKIKQAIKLGLPFLLQSLIILFIINLFI